MTVDEKKLHSRVKEYKKHTVKGGELETKISKLLENFIVGMLRNRGIPNQADRHELFNDILAGLFSHIRIRFQPKDLEKHNFLSLVAAVTKNKRADHIKKAMRQVPSKSLDAMVLEQAAPEMSAGALDQVMALLFKTELSQDEMKAMFLYLFEKMPIRKISDLTGISKSSVDRLLQSARKKMAAKQQEAA